MFSKIITSFAGQLFVVLLGLAIVSACSMQGEAKTMNMDRLTGTHWELKKLNGYEATIERAPTLSFTKDRMNGFNGCNRIFSNYAAGDDGTVSFGHLGSTRMACRNAAGDLEKAVNQTLAATQLFAVSRDGLNLMDSERNILMILSPKAAE